MSTAVTAGIPSHKRDKLSPVGLDGVRLLLLLARDSGDLPVKALARKAGVKVTSVYMALSRLRRGGLIVTRRVLRGSADGRVLNQSDNQLTPAGAKLAHGLIRLRREIGPALWSRLGLPNLPVR